MQIVGEFMKFGVVGAVALLSLWVAWKKDRETKALYETMFDRVITMHEQYQALVREIDDTLDTAVRALERRSREIP